MRNLTCRSQCNRSDSSTLPCRSLASGKSHRPRRRRRRFRPLRSDRFRNACTATRRTHHSCYYRRECRRHDRDLRTSCPKGSYRRRPRPIRSPSCRRRGHPVVRGSVVHGPVIDDAIVRGAVVRGAVVGSAVVGGAVVRYPSGRPTRGRTSPQPSVLPSSDPGSSQRSRSRPPWRSTPAYPARSMTTSGSPGEAWPLAWGPKARVFSRAASALRATRSRHRRRD